MSNGLYLVLIIAFLAYVFYGNPELVADIFGAPDAALQKRNAAIATE